MIYHTQNQYIENLLGYYCSRFYARIRRRNHVKSSLHSGLNLLLGYAALLVGRRRLLAME